MVGQEVVGNVGHGGHVGVGEADGTTALVSGVGMSVGICDVGMSVGICGVGDGVNPVHMCALERVVH